MIYSSIISAAEALESAFNRNGHFNLACRAREIITCARQAKNEHGSMECQLNDTRRQLQRAEEQLEQEKAKNEQLIGYLNQIKELAANAL